MRLYIGFRLVGLLKPMETIIANRRSDEKEQFWRLVLAEQAQSGLSIRKFCQQQDLAEASFHAWKREIKNRDAAQHSNTNPVDQLLPVKLIDNPKQQVKHDAQPTLEVQLSTGTILRFFEATQ